jgi:hypothetical protein
MYRDPKRQPADELFVDEAEAALAALSAAAFVRQRKRVSGAPPPAPWLRDASTDVIIQRFVRYAPKP